MRVYLCLWCAIMCSMLASAFRMQSFNAVRLFPASNPPLGVRSCTTPLCMAACSSRKRNSMRREYSSNLRGNKQAQQAQFPKHLRFKSSNRIVQKKNDHIPTTMRRKPSERVLPLPAGENRLRKRQGIATKLAARDNRARKEALTLAQLAGEVARQEDEEEEDEGLEENAEDEDLELQQFKQKIIKARRQKDYAEIVQTVKSSEETLGESFAAPMAAYAIKLLTKLNETALAAQLLPIWYSHLHTSSESGLDVVQISSVVKQFCKCWDVGTAVEICKHYGLDTSTWTFRYDGQDASTAEELARHVLPDLFMGFCARGDIQSALDMSRGMTEYGLTVDNAAASTVMRQVLTMGTAEQLLRYLGTVRKQLRPADTPEELQLVAGRFGSNATFVKGCVSNDDLPEDSFPEVVFVGRSNVGKSSLLNALVARHNMARTSNTPGKTQEFNYFLVGPHQVRTSPKYHTRPEDDAAVARSPQHAQYRRPFYMVDVPGLGYAKVSKLQRKGWFKQLSSYIRSRATLQAVCHLVDSRVGLMESDIELMKLLKDLPPHVPYVAVITKMDKLASRSKYPPLESTLEQIRQNLTECGLATPERHVAMLSVSAKEKQGVIDLWKVLIEKVVLEQAHEVEVNRKRAAKAKSKVKASKTVKDDAKAPAAEEAPEAEYDEFKA